MMKRLGACLLLTLGIPGSLAAAGDLGSITAGSLNAVSISGGTINGTTISGVTVSGSTVNAGSGNEVVLNSSGITLTPGTGTNNKLKWSDGNAILSDSNSLQLSGLAGGHLYVRSNGDVAIEAGLDGSGAVVLAASAPPRVSNFSGLGSTNFVCHDNSGNLYSSGTTCDGSAPAPPAAEIAALRREIAELRAQLEALLAQR